MNFIKSKNILMSRKKNKKKIKKEIYGKLEEGRRNVEGRERQWGIALVFGTFFSMTER